MSGFIYAIGCGSAVKIGWSAKPHARVRDLAVGNPAPIALLGTIPGTKQDEKALHHRLQRFRLRGEWYSNNGDVADFVATMTANVVTPAQVSAVDKVINDLGGTGAAARTLHCRPAVVSNWRKRGRIPANQYLVVAHAMRRLGKGELAPEICGLEPPRLRAVA